AHGPASLEEDFPHGGLFAHGGPAGRGVAQEELVELRPLDVVGHRVPVVQTPLEDDGTGPPGLLVPEERAVLLLEAGRADLLGDSELLEDRKVEGEERLADVEPGKLLLLQDDDRASGAGEHRRDSRARGPSADDNRIVEFAHWAILSLPRSHSRTSRRASGGDASSTGFRWRSRPARPSR